MEAEAVKISVIANQRARWCGDPLALRAPFVKEYFFSNWEIP